jgi:hypothetical protein
MGRVQKGVQARPLLVTSEKTRQLRGQACAVCALLGVRGNRYSRLACQLPVRRAEKAVHSDWGSFSRLGHQPGLPFPVLAQSSFGLPAGDQEPYHQNLSLVAQRVGSEKAAGIEQGLPGLAFRLEETQGPLARRATVPPAARARARPTRHNSLEVAGQLRTGRRRAPSSSARLPGPLVAPAAARNAASNSATSVVTTVGSRWIAKRPFVSGLSHIPSYSPVFPLSQAAAEARKVRRSGWRGRRGARFPARRGL